MIHRGSIAFMIVSLFVDLLKPYRDKRKEPDVHKGPHVDVLSHIFMYIYIYKKLSEIKRRAPELH